MSAYIVDLNHVAFLVQAGTSLALGQRHSTLTWIWNIDHEANTYERETLPQSDYKQAQRVGQMLWDENIASVQARYPGDKNPPGPTDRDFEYPEQVPHFDIFEPAQVLASCDCYEYQSCEHPGWPASEAKAYIDALRKRAWTSLPGYGDASWGAPLTMNARVEAAKVARDECYQALQRS